MERRESPKSEQGAVLLTVLFSMITLLAVAALVLDLAAVRVNRAVSQTLADSAATAGALDAEGGNGMAGCETAFDYLELNLPSGDAFTGGDCLSLPTSCDVSTTPVTTSASAGMWTATVTYPVADDSSLLQPSAISRPTQALHADDGSQCERFGVSLTSTRSHTFARIIGARTQTSEIHAVAKTAAGGGSDIAINLLILERYECNVLRANGGGGGNSGIIVDAVYDSATNTLLPGYIAVDSDGSVGCGGNGVLDTNGANALIRADGLAGCAGQIGTHVAGGGLVAGEGCGQIQLLAPGTPGCNYPACTGSGVTRPDPSSMPARLTRAPVDHAYNCKASYPMPSGWEIEGCSEPAAPHIDNLVAAYGGTGTPAGFTRWTNAGYSCNFNGTVVVPAGDWFINCSNFRPGTVVFGGGNVVFDGRVSLTSSDVLAFNADGTSSFPYTAASNSGVVYFRDGRISKGGQASFIVKNSMVYISETADLKMSGGAGILEWTAPTTGNFAGLAMWAETSAVTSFAGSSGLTFDGVFFAPWSQISYSGNGSQEQAAAQFIARSLYVSGNGALELEPVFSRSILWPSDSQSQLIR